MGCRPQCDKAALEAARAVPLCTEQQREHCENELTTSRQEDENKSPRNVKRKSIDATREQSEKEGGNAYVEQVDYVIVLSVGYL